jgi:hemolysin activation/secretion protein
MTGMAASRALPAPHGGAIWDGDLPARWRASIFVLVVLVLLAPLLSLEPAEAQTRGQDFVLFPLEATINQNAVMRQEFSPPPKKQRTLRGKLGEPVAGVAPEKLAETRFTLRSVEFEAPADIHLDPAIFAPAWQDLIGKEISLKDFAAALDSIDDIYRQHDYVVIAQAPPQPLASGHIRIVAYEVYVTDLEVKGGTAGQRRRLYPVFARIEAMRPLHQTAIYRQLLIAEDLLGGELTADWFQIEGQPGGAARLEITIPSSARDIVLSFDNYGGANIGPLQASARAHVQDVFGLFESTDLTTLTNPANPSQITMVGFQQAVPLGADGLSLNYGLANSWSNPGGAARDEGLHSEVLIANLGISYALVRELDRNVMLTAGINGNNSSVDVTGGPSTRDRTRWVSVGAEYDDVIDGVGVVLVPAFLEGIDAFQANNPFNDFQVATLNGGATANLTDTLQAQLLFSGQYAFSTLPPAVLGFYGGEVFGRAYDPGALAGNSLAAAALQIGQHIDTGLPWLSDLNLFAFADYGAAWNPAGSPYEFASLGSAGVGLRAAIGENLVLTALVAQPLYHESQLAALGVQQSTRLRFSLSLRF